MEFQTLKIVQDLQFPGVFYLYLNNPSRKNALSMDFFSELPKALDEMDRNPSVRVVVLSSESDYFCSGIDLTSFNSILPNPRPSASDRDNLRKKIRWMQSAISSMESCRKPVIAAVDGGCIGGGVDLIAACDFRYCTDKAFFSVKEVDLAIVADLGTLQRLPTLVGFGNAAEMAITGKRVSGVEAKELGLVQRVFSSRREMEEEIRKVASEIAEKSPIAVMGTKTILLKSRDLSVGEGLDHVATWNSAMLPSDDLKEAIKAHLQKRKPVFAKL